MTCDLAVEALHDGTATPDLAAHLAICADCRSLAEDLVKLQLAARALPREIAPATDLWPGIARRIRPRRARWTWAAAAAMFLAVAGATVALWPEPPPVEVAWERDLDAATAELRVALETRDGIDPDTRALVEENLAIIDRAVSDTRAALAASPDDARLQKALVAMSEQRIGLLRTAVNIPKD